MPDSFAGITVPEGEPGALRGSANRLKAAASGLRESGSELQGMPSSIGTWEGPASGNYAASCLSQSEALGRMANGWTQAATVTSAFADVLEEARQDARAAIEDARDATKRIKEARTELAAATKRFKDAVARAETARGDLSLGGATGVPPPGAQEALNSAEADADKAEGEMRIWRTRLERAEDDLDRAQRRGQKAEREADRAAKSTRTALGAIDAGAPNWIPPSVPALKPITGPKPDKKWYEKAGDWLSTAADDTVDWTGGQLSQVPKGFENGVNGIGGMFDRAYRGSPITRGLDPGSYDPSLDPGNPLYQHESPIETAKGMVNWDDFSNGRVGEGFGELLPGFLLGGAGGAAVRTGSRTAPKSAPSKPAPATAPTPAPKGPANMVVRDSRDGSIVFRTGPDGQLVREGGEGIPTLLDPRELRNKEGGLGERALPGEAGRHGTPPPAVKTPKQAVAETLRVLGKALEDLGG